MRGVDEILVLQVVWDPNFGILFLIKSSYRLAHHHQPGNHYIGLIKNLRSLQKGELNMFEVFMMWSFFGWSLSRGMIKIWKNHTESGFLVCRDHLLSIHDFDDEIFQDNRLSCKIASWIIILMKIDLALGDVSKPIKLRESFWKYNNLKLT